MKQLQLWHNIKIYTIWRIQFLFSLLNNRLTKNNISIMKIKTNNKPLLYSCSGCSSAAQMANYIAIQLDRMNVVEMSCIAGVGGDVKHLVRLATSGRKIIAIDGCPLACSKACLGNHSIKPDIYIDLSSMGVPKKKHVDFDMRVANEILTKIKIRSKESSTKYTCAI
ncbi:MAG: putative zinc-binding protein [Sediminibacterium sp.]|nr:putative zinc-binding protein [Sediminibacterium sp.]TXT33019.1 MAG: DGC domain-containing protein [Chitinophagaceae bacterium]